MKVNEKIKYSHKGEVARIQTAAYPEVTTAAIEGSKTVGNKLVYRFGRAMES